MILFWHANQSEERIQLINFWSQSSSRWLPQSPHSLSNHLYYTKGYCPEDCSPCDLVKPKQLYCTALLKKKIQKNKGFDMRNWCVLTLQPDKNCFRKSIKNNCQLSLHTVQVLSLPPAALPPTSLLRICGSVASCSTSNWSETCQQSPLWTWLLFMIRSINSLLYKEEWCHSVQIMFLHYFCKLWVKLLISFLTLTLMPK